MIKNIKRECGSSTFGKINTEFNSLECDDILTEKIKELLLTCDLDDSFIDLEDIDNPTCSYCSENCNGCIVDKDYCKSCSFSRFHVENKRGICFFENYLLHYFFDNSNTINYWRECNSNCLNCNGPEFNECTSCSTGKILTLSNECSSECPEGSYNNGLTGCEDCSISCETCEDEKNKCLNCSFGNFFIGENKCGSSCEFGSFKTEDDYCELCNYECFTCQSSPENCIICQYDFYLVEGQIGCFSECPEGYFLDLSDIVTPKCKYCDLNCKSCVDLSTKCLSCNDNYYFELENSCIDDCPDGYFENNENNKCEKCDPSCLICSKSGKQCLECKENYIRNSNNECILNCSPGYVMGDLECESCSPPCNTCINTTNTCLTCITNFFLLENSTQCLNECPEKYFSDNRTKTCKKCKTPCDTCITEEICLSCVLPFFFNQENYQCLETCPTENFGNSNNLCEKCIANCKDCNNNYECLKCSDNFLLEIEQNLECVSECASGYYESNNNSNGIRICLKCDSNCKECFEESNKCSGCSNHQFLIKEDLSCIDKIPFGYYYDYENYTIEKCHETCESCFDKEIFNCLSCFKNTELNNLKNFTCVPLCEYSEFKYYNDEIKEDECLKMNKCISNFIINSPIIIDINSENLIEFSFDYDFNADCTEIITKELMSKASGTFEEIFEEYYLFDIIFPEYISIEDIYFSTDTITYYVQSNKFKEGTYKITGKIINNKDESEITNSSMTILGRTFNLIPVLNIPLSEKDESNNYYFYKKDIVFPNPIIINAKDSYDEFWNGINSQGEELSCSWECAELNGHCNGNSMLIESELTNSNSLINTLCYVDINSYEGLLSHKLWEVSNYIFVIEFTLYSTYRNALNTKIFIEINFIKNDEFSIFSNINQDNNINNNTNSNSNSNSNSNILNSLQNIKPEEFKNFKNSNLKNNENNLQTNIDDDNKNDNGGGGEQDENSLFKILSALEKILNSAEIIIKQDSDYLKADVKYLIDLDIEGLEYEWKFIETDILNARGNNENSENNRFRRQLNINSFNYAFETPTKQISSKINTSILPLGKYDLILKTNFKNNSGENLINKSITKRVVNESSPSNGLCLPNKETVNSIGETIIIKTRGWVSSGKLMYSIWYIDKFSSQLTEYFLEEEVEIKDIPLGKYFYLEAYDINTKKSSFIFCDFESVLKEDISVNDLNNLISVEENTVDKISDPEGYLIKQKEIAWKESKKINLLGSVLSVVSFLSNKQNNNNNNNNNNKNNSFDEIIKNSVKLHSKFNENIKNGLINNKDESKNIKIINQSNQLSKITEVSNDSKVEITNNLNNIINNEKSKKAISQNEKKSEEINSSIYDSFNNFSKDSFNELSILMDKTLDSSVKIIKNLLSLGQEMKVNTLSITETIEVLSKAVNISSSSKEHVEVAERGLLDQKIFPIPNKINNNQENKQGNNDNPKEENNINANSPTIASSLDAIGINVNLKNKKSNEITQIKNLNSTNLLIMPDLNTTDSTKSIGQTSCLLVENIDKTGNDETCTTWYDYDSYEVECECSISGVVMNVLDDQFSTANKSIQFPEMKYDFCKKYTLYYVIINFLILLLLTSFV